MYLFDNELFAMRCIAKYAMEGLVVNSRNGQFAHCPEPRPKGQKWRLSGDKGYWLTFNDHQHQGLLQSVDFDRRCFYTYEVKLWLNTKPPGYEGLYEIYNEFISGKHHPLFGVPHTEEHKKKLSEAKFGENNPNYGVPHTEEWKKAHSEKMSGRYIGALSPRSKAIIAIKPDGTELHFGSIREAARELGIDSSFLCRLLKRGKSPTNGKLKGWQFLFT